MSEEDLWTYVGRKFKRLTATIATPTAEALRGSLDPIRFPWLGAARRPTREELERASVSTAILLAATKLGTSRRGSASTIQESQVSMALDEAGFKLDASRTPVDVLDALPRGTFSHERKVAGAKCDVPVRLLDGRLLGIECKVSNGPKNGWKRIVREVGGKSQTWRQRFGTQVITGAVVGGAFDLSCLKTAQRDYDVFIVFEHALDRLTRFITAAKP